MGLYLTLTAYAIAYDAVQEVASGSSSVTVTRTEWQDLLAQLVGVDDDEDLVFELESLPWQSYGEYPPWDDCVNPREIASLLRRARRRLGLKGRVTLPAGRIVLLDPLTRDVTKAVEDVALLSGQHTLMISAKKGVMSRFDPRAKTREQIRLHDGLEVTGRLYGEPSRTVIARVKMASVDEPSDLCARLIRVCLAASAKRGRVALVVS